MKLCPAFSGIALAATFTLGHALNASAQFFDPPALYLTWQRDPTTTMTIQWHTRTNAGVSEVHFRAAKDAEWQRAEGRSQALVDSDRHVHTVELTGLRPDSYYLFRLPEGTNEWKFRTMPKDLTLPVRFITGGDVYQDERIMDAMNKRAANLDPFFVALGGDLAYANDDPRLITRYFTFLDSWKRNMVAPDGRLIPLLPGIGNHEVRGGFNQPVGSSPHYYTLFAMPGIQGYNHLDFGKYLSVLLLDTDHTHPIAGEQTEWLKSTLAKRTRVPHVFPIYHVPGYSSHRAFAGTNASARASLAVREHWAPLFDQYGVRIAFENHDHAFKRTHPIRGGKLDPKGVIYLGDGCWAVPPRRVHPVSETWYLARAEAVRHFFLVTLHDDRRHIVAIAEDGKLIDEVYQRVK